MRLRKVASHFNTDCTEMGNLYEMFASGHEEFFPPQSIMFVYVMK